MNTETIPETEPKPKAKAKRLYVSLYRRPPRQVRSATLRQMALRYDGVEEEVEQTFQMRVPDIADMAAIQERGNGLYEQWRVNGIPSDRGAIAVSRNHCQAVALLERLQCDEDGNALDADAEVQDDRPYGAEELALMSVTFEQIWIDLQPFIIELMEQMGNRLAAPSLAKSAT